MRSILDNVEEVQQAIAAVKMAAWKNQPIPVSALIVVLNAADRAQSTRIDGGEILVPKPRRGEPPVENLEGIGDHLRLQVNPTVATR